MDNFHKLNEDQHYEERKLFQMILVAVSNMNNEELTDVGFIHGLRDDYVKLVSTKSFRVPSFDHYMVEALTKRLFHLNQDASIQLLYFIKDIYENSSKVEAEHWFNFGTMFCLRWLLSTNQDFQLKVVLWFLYHLSEKCMRFSFQLDEVYLKLNDLIQPIADEEFCLDYRGEEVPILRVEDTKLLNQEFPGVKGTHALARKTLISISRFSINKYVPHII